MTDARKLLWDARSNIEDALLDEDLPDSARIAIERLHRHVDDTIAYLDPSPEAAEELEPK